MTKMPHPDFFAVSTEMHGFRQFRLIEYFNMATLKIKSCIEYLSPAQIFVESEDMKRMSTRQMDDLSHKFLFDMIF